MPTVRRRRVGAHSHLTHAESPRTVTTERPIHLSESLYHSSLDGDTAFGCWSSWWDRRIGHFPPSGITKSGKREVFPSLWSVQSGRAKCFRKTSRTPSLSAPHVVAYQKHTAVSYIEQYDVQPTPEICGGEHGVALERSLSFGRVAVTARAAPAAQQRRVSLTWATMGPNFICAACEDNRREAATRAFTGTPSIHRNGIRFN